MADQIKTLFCSRCQIVTPHKASVDGSGEFLFECTAMTGETEKYTDEVGVEQTRDIPCTRFVKFAANTTPEQFANLLGEHVKQNVGQVSMEGQEKTLSLLLAVDAPEVAPATGTNEEIAANPQPAEGELPEKVE